MLVLVYRIFRHPLYIIVWFGMNCIFFYCSIRLKVYDFLFMYTYLSPLLIHKTVQCIKNRTPNHQKIYHMLGYTQKNTIAFDDPPHIYSYNRQIITLYDTRKCFQCICHTHKFVVVFYILFISLFLHTKVKLKLLPAFILY